MTQQADTAPTRKSVAGWLDSAANNCYAIDQRPASRKQVWYLAGLLVDAGHDHKFVTGGDTNYVLTIQRASMFIDNLKSQQAA